MWAFFVMFLGLGLVVAGLRHWAKSYKDEYARRELVFLTTWLGGVVALIGWWPFSWYLCSITTGAMPEYSNGQRIGYVTKVSHKGFFWKTWEVEVQIGAGEQAALQKPHHFSIPDGPLVKAVQDGLGKQAMIIYREWFIMPFWLGSSGSEILEVRFK